MNLYLIQSKVLHLLGILITVPLLCIAKNQSSQCNNPSNFRIKNTNYTFDLWYTEDSTSIEYDSNQYLQLKRIKNVDTIFKVSRVRSVDSQILSVEYFRLGSNIDSVGSSGFGAGPNGELKISPTKYSPVYELIKLDTGSIGTKTSLVPRLTGTWELFETIQEVNGEGVGKKPTGALWQSPGSKPYTKIIMDSAQTFTISQFCLKCPMIKWKGSYTIETSQKNALNLPFLRFIENRDPQGKKGASFTSEFNGYISHLNDGELRLTDKTGTIWIYKFIAEEVKQ